MLVIKAIYGKFISTKYWPLGLNTFLLSIVFKPNYSNMIVYCKRVKSTGLTRNENIVKMFFLVFKNI